MSDPSGRVKPIAAGDMMQPACCAMCGSTGNEDGYADPAIFVEWHGNIYFCPSCSFEIGALFGAVEGHRYDSVVAKLQEAELTIVAQQAEIARLETNVDAYRSLFNPPDFSGDSVTANSINPVVKPEPSKDAEESSGSVREAEAKPAQSVKSKRSNDVAEPASSDFAASLGL